MNILSKIVLFLVIFLPACGGGDTNNASTKAANSEPTINAYNGYWKGTLASSQYGHIGETHLIVDEEGNAYLYYAYTAGNTKTFIKYYAAKGKIDSDQFIPDIVYSDNASSSYIPSLIWNKINTTFQFNFELSTNDIISGTYRKDHEVITDYGDVMLFHQELSNQTFPVSVYSNNYEVLYGSYDTSYVYIGIGIDDEGNISGSYTQKFNYSIVDEVPIIGKATLLESNMYDIEINLGNRSFSGRGVSIGGVLHFITIQDDNSDFALISISRNGSL